MTVCAPASARSACFGSATSAGMISAFPENNRSNLVRSRPTTLYGWPRRSSSAPTAAPIAPAAPTTATLLPPVIQDEHVRPIVGRQISPVHGDALDFGTEAALEQSAIGLAAIQVHARLEPLHAALRA